MTTLTQLELSGLAACAKSPRGYYWMATTMQSLERKGMVYGQPGKDGQTAYFLTEEGRRELAKNERRALRGK